MSLIVDGTSGVTFNDSSLQGAAASPYVLKNRIINGDFRIDQRNAGASVTPASAATTYTLDRWNFYPSQASKFTTQQNAGSVTPPAGFSNYLGVTSSSAYSLAAGDLFVLQQSIEGFNVSDLNWGTASAQTVTLSFWVRSSLTGTFAGVLQNSAQNRTYPFTYTISSANTWTQISITIAGDTTGTWLTTNGIGLRIVFSLGTGSTYSGTAGAWVGTGLFSVTGATSVVGTNGATFYITGVQLEQNTSVTPFERRLITNELQLCQRYYQFLGGQVQSIFGDVYQSTGNLTIPCTNLQTMRASPTAATVGTWTTSNVASTTYFAGTTSTTISFATVSSNLRTVAYNNTNSGFSLSAEL